MASEMNPESLENVPGGAERDSFNKLVCSSCGYSEDLEVAKKFRHVNIMPGEMTECPKCHQVTMMLRK